MASIEELSSTLQTYLTSAQVNQVKRAYFYAEQAHEGQRRRSGEPYVTHPLAVAGILADMHMDHQSLMAAMLHDVIEDTAISKKALEEQFGATVANLVDGVSKLTQMEFQSKAEAQAENFQKMALAMAKDIRVILVKLADRLHNMRTLGVLKPEKRRRIARETLDMYAPIAQRLGMHNIRVEFEDLGFATLHPMRSTRIHAAVLQARGHRKELIEQIKESIDHCLVREGHSAVVSGREKHLYSIYKKMDSKKKSFSEIMDIYAFRILVDDVDTCYRVLGCIHSLYKPVPGQFKDYIAIPKANGYQSLHTVLFGLHGVPIEIQIRTHEMEEMANYGIAAHWLYKTNDGEPLNGSHTRARQWLQGLLELQQRAGDSMEFIESVKLDLFPDEVYVFTPKGKIMELPQGATAVDFAYAVHTDVGNKCIACRINRRLAPLSEPLQSGQTVEIMTAHSPQANPAWLNFVVTSKARSNIRHLLKNQRAVESINLGRRLLDEALAGMNSSINSLSELQTLHLLENTGHDSIDGVLADIGLGKRSSFLTAHQLVRDSDESKTKPTAQQSLTINGTEGFRLNFARCCYPIPGDAIIGFISAERGIVVHTDNCHNSNEFRNNPERSVPLQWAEEVEGEFSAELKIELVKSRGIIAVLANRINSIDANIEKISIEDEDPRMSIVNVVVGVHSRIHLARIMKRIRQIADVIKVSRLTH
ncbi:MULTISPECIES: bifunctional GTP diphosphokinase/guanosine-3',5'-bis pyrophosphate 3'-pyrophosphohydrolase [Dasania]|uniref:bifunctional GTP diphosphokinase/guanosine-3',5'-bis pyrophosphate 3'-pyrophosphohydrolase n=1 Tax=Dasania TaxID=503005 RepID=UPI002815D687|nr:MULTISPECIES: bifunctional GTP diphosphokinase/guanosine-3',5'-bis pyrophosphate 3'-pyrophosphohydrolase [Dasania]